MHLSLLDFLVIILYAVMVLGVGHLLMPGRTGDENEIAAPAPVQRALPWWAIGTSLIAANISAEQIIGMSGSAYALGLAIASYEWMAAAALLLVGKFLLPIFLGNGIHTMPEFLRRRYGPTVQLIMAVLWIILYVFVILTSVLWLGATAMHAVVPDLTMTVSLVLLGLFVGNYALYVGLRQTSVTDAVQIGMLVLGGMTIVYFALTRIAGQEGPAGIAAGLHILATRLPDHFHMVLTEDNPYYKYLPGTAVLLGGMWVVNLAYWGFNQSILQRVLTAHSIRETQRGVVFAAFLKLLIPVLVVLPGIAAALLIEDIDRPDLAYPVLMTMLPHGLMGFVFVALLAAIVASMGSTLSSIATIFSRDVVPTLCPDINNRQVTIAARVVAIGALGLAMIATFPLLGRVDQAFQYIQEFTGFLTPAVVTIFLGGIVWQRANEIGALSATIGSVIVSFGFWLFLPSIPFLHRIGYVLLVAIGLLLSVSLITKSQGRTSTIEMARIDFRTSTSYNLASLAVIAILTAIYVFWW